MGTIEIKDRFKEEVERFLIGVSSETLDKSYGELVDILLAYKGLLTKDDVYAVFSFMDKESKLNRWQEEVIWEISNRLEGHCRPGKEISVR